MVSRSEPDMLKVSKNRDTVSYRKIGHCLDCDHTWTPRTAKGEKPSRCSKCGSYNCAWDDEPTESSHAHNTPTVKKQEKEPTVKHTSPPRERTLEPSLIPAVATLQGKTDENNEQNSLVWRDKTGNDESDVLTHPVDELKIQEIATGSTQIETEPENTSKEIETPNTPELPDQEETQEKGEENLDAWPPTNDDEEIMERAKAILTRDEDPKYWIQDELLLSRQMGISVDELESALCDCPNFEVIPEDNGYSVAYYSDDELTESETPSMVDEVEVKEAEGKEQAKGGVPIVFVAALILGFGGLYCYIWSLSKPKKTKKNEELSPAERAMFRLSDEGRNQEITNRIRAVNDNLRNPVLSPYVRPFPSIM